MRIWVDCTAAAHPLVLRPIIERLRDRGARGRDHRARVRADDRHPRPARARATRSSAATGAARRPARGWRSPGAAARWRRWARRRRLRPRARATARSTSPWSARCCGSARCRCRTTSTRACSASSRFAPRSRVLVPDAIAVEAMRRGGRGASASCSAIPGSRRTTTSPTSIPTPRCPSELGVEPRNGAGGRPPAARDFRLSRATTRSTSAVLDRLAADGAGGRRGDPRAPRARPRPSGPAPSRR